MRAWIGLALPVCLLVTLTSASGADSVGWSQDLNKQEMVALGLGKPVVVFFVGNGKFDMTLFSREPVDQLGDKAEYAWVGSNLEDKTTPDQIALEKKFNVTKFPTLVLLRAVKTGSSGGSDNYTFRESMRCAVAVAGQCTAAVVAAVKAGK